MSDVTVYSGSNCHYCERAKALLKKKNVEFQEFNVELDSTKLDEMLALSGGRKTVPQIFIDGAHIGGCDNLYALNSAGKLDALLDLS